MQRYTRWGFITFFLPFLFLFQNCEHSLELANTEESYNLESLGIQELHIPILGRTPSSHNVTAQLHTGTAESLIIDMHNSVIRTTKGTHYCPGYDFFYSLQHILNHAHLCVNGVKQNSFTNTSTTTTDKVCSTEFIPASAVLITQTGDKIALGSKDQSCNQVELCSPSRDDFAVLIEMFLEIKDSFKCITL